ncbi:MAG: HEPN domain-containing protein [Desulfobulbaceae bacterium]|nr:HEPN domain-containing protein [Desulfobulbaceae bacterium]
MKLEEHIQYWLDSADHDWDTAASLFSTGRYDWCLFIGHLVLEKILKAHFVKDNNNQLPRRTHNLIKLAEHTKINLTEEQKILLDEINDFNLEVRYPQFKNEFYKKCTKDFSEYYFKQIEGMATWLKSRITLLP